LSELYLNREQSQAKHEILRRYLIPFSNKILSSWPSIDFIDCFAGPWKNVDTDNLTDTSIGIALSILSDVALKRGHTTQNRSIRCIFNEANPASFRKLKSFVDRSAATFPMLKIEVVEGAFEDNAAKIRQLADHSFQLLFVDPTGYTGFSPDALRLFKGRSSELIVNFMRRFIERFVSGKHTDRNEALAALLGQTRAQKYYNDIFSIQIIEESYLDMLRNDLGYKYAGYSPIHNSDKNEIHFNLAYATNHTEGMEVMRNAEYKALSDHDRRRFTKSLSKDGGDLFSGMLGEMEIFGPYLRMRKEHKEKGDSVLIDLVSRYPNGVKFSELAAVAQQSLYLKRSELGDLVVELSKREILRNTWHSRNGKKPTGDDLIINI
jgi:three-Cys-motif partner protein